MENWREVEYSKENKIERIEDWIIISLLQIALVLYNFKARGVQIFLFVWSLGLRTNIFNFLVYDDMQGGCLDKRKWAWMHDVIFAKINIQCSPPDDSSKRGACWGIGRQKHMLWQFTRSNSLHAKIKWYATAREPSQWKQNQDISMFQLCFNQGRFRKHSLLTPFNLTG